jgi:hypothetical protein
MIRTVQNANKNTSLIQSIKNVCKTVHPKDPYKPHYPHCLTIFNVFPAPIHSAFNALSLTSAMNVKTSH